MGGESEWGIMTCQIAYGDSFRGIDVRQSHPNSNSNTIIPDTMPMKNIIATIDVYINLIYQKLVKMCKAIYAMCNTNL